MKVVHFHRRPRTVGEFSFERVFSDIRRELPRDIVCVVATARFVSSGLWRRVYNIFEAALRQGDVNHVTGDIHYITFLLDRKKTVLTVADCASLERLSGIRREIFRLLWYVIPVRRVSLVTVISESAKKELLRHLECSPQKIRVVHCCVSSQFQPAPKEFNTEKPRILQIGTAPNKNLLRTAEALSGLSCTLNIIGRLSESQRGILDRFGVDYHSASEVSDELVLEAYRFSDMVVFASTYEGFGLPIIEANAIGRPVVTSNILSMPEVAGRAACIVDPFDPRSIRDGVDRVIREPAYREELVREGFANVRRFSADRIAAEYATLYNELASTAARR